MEDNTYSTMATILITALLFISFITMYKLYWERGVEIKSLKEENKVLIDSLKRK